MVQNAFLTQLIFFLKKIVENVPVQTPPSVEFFDSFLTGYLISLVSSKDP